MSSSIIALRKKDQLTGENYAKWKSKLNMIIVIVDLHFVLMEECPPFPTKYASQSVRDAYDRWTKANDKARLHILASMSDILSKKHEIMVTARQIMDSLREMFGQPSIHIKQEANVAHSRRFVPSSSRSEKIQKRKEGKRKGPTIAVEGKGKAKVVIKGKCFHCNVDKHWKTNCPKYLVKNEKKKKILDSGATNHVCSSLQETSSFKQLEESEMTLKVGMGDVISARVVGDAKLGHINLDQIERLVKNGLLNKLEDDDSLPPCGSCLEGKMTKRPFTGKGYRAKEPLELIHSDCGPMNHKTEALEKFKEYKTEVENLLSKKIKILRSNRGGEYMDLRIPGLYDRTWNPIPTLSTWLCQFIGYPKETRGGLFFDPQENRVFVSTNATFLEEDHMRDHKPRSKLVLNEATDESTRVVDEVGPSSRVDETTTSGQSHHSQSLRMPRRSGRIVSQPNRYLGLTETQVVIPDDGVEDPLSYKQTMNDVDKDQWVKAMDLEMESMYFNLVWELVDLPEGSIRILLPIATFYDYEIWQMDVKTAFLNGNLEESIFMSQPEGFITQGQEQKVCNLNRFIYGLKQTSRSWNIRFDTAIKSYSFDQNVDEPCVYKKINKGKVAFLVLYVDDILLIGNDVGYLTDVKAWLAVQFQMKDLGEAQYVLGIQNSKKSLLPFRHEVHLSKEQCPKTPQEVEDMRRIPYASVMGSLMYAMLCTRLDICYAVGIVSSIKQGCIADSTMEAEYVAACEAAKEAVWLRKFLHDLEVVPNMNLPITLYCDNSGTVANSKEPHSHKQGKHIESKYYLIREIMQRGDVIVTKITSEHNIADSFTKTLTAKVFEGHLESLGLRDMYIR
ncbi:gag/pol protein [Cucumis melo var. makuwa]|uniref:Gag/pol protein n=1 Tax=Cucumis melo var. makuwa TaxID=1194695 RepID=A0A5A7SKC5_CUCMM|nr:gag/pol protein [Cucumis melo var. makuwa]TYK11614.1 gag/pol protein [Cucumis melo var. makuwa]